MFLTELITFLYWKLECGLVHFDPTIERLEGRERLNQVISWLHYKTEAANDPKFSRVRLLLCALQEGPFDKFTTQAAFLFRELYEDLIDLVNTYVSTEPIAEGMDTISSKDGKQTKKHRARKASKKTVRTIRGQILEILQYILDKVLGLHHYLLPSTLRVLRYEINLILTKADESVNVLNDNKTYHPLITLNISANIMYDIFRYVTQSFNLLLLRPY